MRVGILGPLEVVADGRTVRVGGARLRTLLIRLALDAGRTVSVDALTSALWPEAGPDDPANALQSLVSRLRQALPVPASVPSAPGGYRLDVAAEHVDALRFEQLARAGARQLRAGDAADAARTLREALALWRGEALADVANAPFATAAIVRLTQLRLGAVEDRIDADLRVSGRPGDLVAELEELTATHPVRERLWVLLLRALDADGRQAEALAAYERCRALLADELGVDPGPELQAAHLAVLRGGARAEPRHGRRSNLRTPLTRFVGRADERARIHKQLQEGRLVTLVGPGGVGKTRLATTYASGVVDTMSGGVWLVELAPVTDPGDVTAAVVAALGLRHDRGAVFETAARDPIDRIAEALSAGDALIVLDNCEHVIDATARLVDDLLGRCPRLRVLATSREPLGIIGEALCAVSPLDVPPPEVTAGEALRYAAVELFADRAAAVRPGFAVTDDNAGLVADICRRLDGLPLAVELAAVRLRAMTLAQVAAGLDDRFRLLTGGSRTALPRHQTLRAVVGWSWSLLSEHERRLAERLAVFPGVITADSAAHMCVLEPVVPGEPIDLLSALVDRSLLQLDDGSAGRYRMLETLREYGMERLAESGLVERTRAAHAAYHVQLAEAAHPHIVTRDQVPWIRRLAAEHDNLLAALHFAAGTGDAATALRLAAGLAMFWTIRGSYSQAAERLRLALRVPGEAPPEARAIVLAVYLLNAVLGGSPADVDAGAAAVLGDERVARHPAAALLEGALALASGDTVAGLAAIDRSLSLDDPWKRGMLWLMRALLAGNDGGVASMARDLMSAAEAFRAAGERWGLATALTFLASARNILGDAEQAVAGLQEAIGLLHELDPDDDAVLQRVWIADARRQQGDVDRARDELLAIVSSPARTSSASALVFARVTLGHLARYDGDLEEARRQYDAADADLGRVPYDVPLDHAVVAAARAHLHVATGDLDAAARDLDAAVRLALVSPDMPLVALIGVGVARLVHARGRGSAAAEVLGAAHALRGAADARNPDVAAVTADLRDRLGTEVFEAAYASGRALDRDAALAVIGHHL